jgi:hypothetical protein
MKILSASCILTLLLGTGPAFSQVNDYFQHNPVWTVKLSCGVSDNCLKTDYTNYYIKGDTSIQGLTYKQIYRKGQGSHHFGYTGSTIVPTNCTGAHSFIENKPDCFLRSQNKKIFLRRPNDTSEHLLYDFDLTVGSTLPLTYNNTSSNIKVTAIDSIHTPYGYLKSFALNTMDYLYEGIGHSKGFYNYLGVLLDCGSYRLDCFSLRDTAYYPSLGPTCNIAVGLTSHEEQASVSVFPNPFSVFTTIHFNVPLNSARLHVYDHQGQLQRNTGDLSGHSIKIEKGTLSPGLYYYKVTAEGRTITAGKLIIE